MKERLGVTLISVPFLIAFIGMAREFGFWQTLWYWFLVFGAIASFVYGLWILTHE